MRPITDWLPITKKEADKRGWSEIDIIIVSGDAYVDHPAFGAAVIGRVLEAEGYKIAIIPQPNWTDDLRDFKKFGKPRLFFGVTSGNMDSMVNHYTANIRLRSDDAYTPGGEAGFRPDYALEKYCQIIKDIYPDTPVIAGGIEASLRRFTHYDYWSDSLKPSVLSSSKADMLVYGMGENAIIEIAKQIDNGIAIEDINNVCQTVIKKTKVDEDTIVLSSHEECLKSKKKFALNFKEIEKQSYSIKDKKLAQVVGDIYFISNVKNPIFEHEQLDRIYELPYTRLPHPKYKKRGDIPAYTMIKHSVNIHRGCFGGCSFCTISAHQGRQIESRTEKSVLRELKIISEMDDFKGNISDLGGPSANMYMMKGKNMDICEKCKRPSCIFPNICANLNNDHNPLINLYKKAVKVKGIRNITIGSGIRYDMLMGNYPGAKEYKRLIIDKHVSGRLKVAPEHTSDKVLQSMRKPSFGLFKEFKKEFHQINKELGKNQQLIPYFISAHPTCNLEDMAELALETKKLNYKLEQVQGFTPTPMTLSTVMYYTGIDPYTMKKVYIVKNMNERKTQQLLFFWYKKDNYKEINKIMNSIGRRDIAKNLYTR